jgi:hypothetical protein
MISKQVKIGSNKELSSAPRNEEANTQRHSFIAGLHVDRPKNGLFVQEPKARQEGEDLQKRKKKKRKPTNSPIRKLRIYVIADGFSDSIC